VLALPFQALVAFAVRAFPADSLEYLGDTALGNTALPVATGADTGGAVGLVLLWTEAGAAEGAGSGAAVASAPHCALRKSFHFIPLSVPASFSALYLHCTLSLIAH
jgi:hypothetical protein